MSGRTIVLGAGGMLATSLADLVQRRGLSNEWAFLTQDDLDITIDSRVEAVVRESKPNWVINASGYTNVDGAESDAAAAHRLNGDAVGSLARACRQHGSLLVHYSTDYVFDGSAHRPWREDDPTGPINEYGRSKFAGERAVVESGCEHLLIRSSWLYAAHGRNFVRTILGRLRSAGKVRVIDDQRGRPTCCDDLAEFTLALIDSPLRGTIHAANDGEASWCEFACAIRDFGAPDATVEPCRTEDFPTPARRPRYSTLDLTRLQHALGRPPRHWREALREVIGQLNARGG